LIRVGAKLWRDSGPPGPRLVNPDLDPGSCGVNTPSTTPKFLVPAVETWL